MFSTRSVNPLPYSDFRSDTATAPTPEMFAAMMKSSLGDDVYNEDDSVKKLESHVAKLTGHEAALFCSSGTMTNQLAHRVHLCSPPQSAMVDIRSHVFNYEAGGISFHSQAAVYPIMPSNGKYLTVDDISSRIVQDIDVHFAPTRVVSLENTLNGTVMPLEEIAKIRELTKEHGIKLHLDGARLWHASIATGFSMKEYCSYFDTISLCLSKGIGAPIGSILVGSEATIKKARHFRLLFGGGWRQAGILAEAALWGIETNWPTMKDTHRRAKTLESAFVQVGCNITSPVDTNMVWVDTSDAGFTVDVLMEELAKKGIKISGSGCAARVVLHYQITDEAVERFIQVLLKVARSSAIKANDDIAEPIMFGSPASLHEAAKKPDTPTKLEGPTTPVSPVVGQKFTQITSASSTNKPPSYEDEEIPRRNGHRSMPNMKRCLFEEGHQDNQVVLQWPQRNSVNLPQERFVKQNENNQSCPTTATRCQYQRHLDLDHSIEQDVSNAPRQILQSSQSMNFYTTDKKVFKLQYRMAHNPASLKNGKHAFAMNDLPPKEANQFKQILNCYENKQYKKGLKGAEQILKKFPENGETLAMKGLFYNHFGKKEEAYEFVRKGLRFNLKSHICWHVYGLLYRSDRNYEEALKCYAQALRIEKDNLQIMHDYSLLQIHTRNYEAYADTRYRLLELRPKNRQFWIGLAIGYHMMGKPDLGIKVLTAFEETLKDEVPEKPDYEHSEMLLYHNSLIQETGDSQAALDHLEAIEKSVCDKKSVKEKRAEYLLALGRGEEAKTAYDILIAHNPDNFAYFDGLRKSVGLGGENLSADDQDKILDMFKSLQQSYPRSNATKRLPLRYATGDAFVKIADEYLRSMLRKGVPSLFVNIKTLYTDTKKEQAIEKLVLGYLAALDKSKGFDHSGSTVEPPTALLWTLYFLAQHFDFQRNTDQALGYINRAIEHTPTLVELYMAKGRILKHAGDLIGAMGALNEARELDLQDRFINSKCTKYMLRADKMAMAEETVVLFARADLADPLNDLVEMQGMWFSLECGESHLRQRQIGRALKRFHQVEKHFNDFTEDQFDFHMYCLRKITLRAYVSLLKLEDQLRSHPYYVRAVKNAVECYVTLFDKPDGDDSEAMEGMTEAEKKKFRNKQRKAELKAQKEADEIKAQLAQEMAKKGGKVDEDPEGLKYTKVEDPIGEALKLLKPLQELAADRIETHLMGFELYIRKNKLLLALKALLKAQKIDENNADLHQQLVRFALTIQKAGDSINSTVKALIDKHWETLYHGKGNDLASFTASFLEKNKDLGSVPHLISAAIAVYRAEPNEKSKAEEILFSMAADKYEKTRSYENCIFAKKTLKSFKSSRVAEFSAKAAEWYPRSAEFKP
ncbi:N-alpha-acetyltransferase 16, NatA auxiliary subunit [Mortierella sp. AM989]|nr:N-alpha-acetyltransferase 16, NatA auxiliary subunit [Mortierella sp. AM989]